MKNTLKFALVATVSLSLLGLTQPAISATDYAVPASPVIVSTEPAAGGINVEWDLVTANPPVTNYVVTAGQGSCPVMVDAKTSKAFLPMTNLSSQNIKVQAVNQYGFSAAAVSANPVSADSLAPSNYKNLQLLQLSDFHGAIEAGSSAIGAAGLAGAFSNDRSAVDATFTLSSGDNFGAAPPISSQFGETSTVLAMNMMGFDATTLGNHEHDRVMQHLRYMIRTSNFDWVVSNYSSLLGMRVSATKKAKSYTLIERDGVTLGVVGFNTPDVAEEVFPGNLKFTYAGKTREVEVSGTLASLEKAAFAARKAGADVVVALVHQGWNQNLNGEAVGPLVDYASKIQGVDLVFGGHSHQEYASVLNGIPTIEVKNSGQEYSRTQVCYDTKAKKVIGSSVEFVTKAMVTATPSTRVTKLVSAYKSKLSAAMDVQIGTVADKSPRGGSPAVERSSEAAIGSYTADLLKEKYGTDLAILNGGGIRDTFPASTYKPANASLTRPSGSETVGPFDVTLGDAYTVFPFGNSVSITELTGAQLWAALENGVSQYPSAGRFPQVAGIKFSFDPSKTVGSRIVSLTTTAGKAIAKDSKIYSVATIDYLVYGGDGYTQFDASKQKVRDLLVDVFVEGLQADMAAGKVTALKTDGRITVIK